MFVAAPILLLALTTAGCEEALKPVAAALQRNDRAEVSARLEAIRPQCAGSSSFHELAGFAGTLAGNFTAAAEELQQAITINPQLVNDPTVFFWFVQALLETNQSARLTAFLSNHGHSLSPPLLFSLGTLFAKHRSYEKAIEYFRQIPGELADDAVSFNLGLAYSHLRQFTEARKYYFQAIDKHPSHVEAYFRVGLDYGASGDARKAIPWLLRARQLAPARPDIAYALTEQLLPLRYFDTAAQIAAEALTANPRDPLLMVASGDVLLAQGKQPEAADRYQTALEQQVKLPGALLGLARIASLKGNVEQARKNLLDALAGDPENAAVSGELGSIEFQEGNWTDARAHLAKAWSSDESNLAVALQLAQTLRHLNRPAESLRLLQPLAPALHNSAAFHFELVQIYAQLGRSAEAQAERARTAALQAKSQNTLHFEDPKTYVF